MYGMLMWMGCGSDVDVLFCYDTDSLCAPLENTIKSGTEACEKSIQMVKFNREK